MKRYFSEIKTGVILLFLSLPVILLIGCANKQADGSGGGFDILKFLQNPFVMVISGIIIAFYMFKHSK